MGLLGSVFLVWHQRVVQRGRDVVSATAFNQQVCAYLRTYIRTYICVLAVRRYMYGCTYGNCLLNTVIHVHLSSH